MGSGCLTPETSQFTSHYSQEPSIPAFPLWETLDSLPATALFPQFGVSSEDPKEEPDRPSA